MRKLLIFCFIFVSFNALSRDGVYLGASMLPVYASGEHSSKSSLLGTGFGVNAGLRVGHVAAELSAKRVKVESKHIGDDDFDTTIFDSLFAGSARFFLGQFNLKLGLAVHHLEMDIYQDDDHKKNLEDDGNYVGLMGGMGINHDMGNSDFYFESTLYPIPDVGLYVIDFEFGLRFYL